MSLAVSESSTVTFSTTFLETTWLADVTRVPRVYDT